MNDLKDEFESVLKKINDNELFKEYMIQNIFFEEPTKGSIEGSYVYTKNSEYFLDYFEKGTVTSTKHTLSKDECLFWLVDSIVTTMGFKYEVKNRNENQDPRRIAFKKMKEIYLDLSPEFFELKNEQIEKILTDNPFDDALFMNRKYER